MGAIKRSMIKDKLIELVDDKSDTGLYNFVRFNVLFVFCCIIFLVSKYVPPRFIFSYLEDFYTSFDYAWRATFRFLHEEILQNLEY